MKTYITLNIGCLECGNATYLNGVFDTLEEAKKSFGTYKYYIAKDDEVEGVYGQDMNVIFEINK